PCATRSRARRRNSGGFGAGISQTPSPGDHRPEQVSGEPGQAPNRVWWGKQGSSLPIIKTYRETVKVGVVPGTWWTDDEVGSNQEAKRDHLNKMFPGVTPFDTPKPERLLERIIHIATKPGDVVLDCFAGSGTTAAVAHKMRRRWVTVELSESNVNTFTRPRLLKVINDEDPRGITSKTEVEFVGNLPTGTDPQLVKQAAELLAPLFEHGTFDELPKVPQKDAAGPLGQLVTFLRDHPETYEALVTNMAKQMRAAAKTKNVTKKLWSGGGGFTELTVGPSMFEDVDGVVVLSDWAVGGELAEAVAAQVGFEYAPDGPFAGKKGKTRLAVIDGMLTTSVVDYLLGHLDDGERLRVVAQALDPDADAYLKARRSGSRAQKVPRDLAKQGRRPSRLVRLDADGTTGDGEKA
ncbi:MAG: DNA methyltransferase, partial [Candidatus Nanopelagicales bacterium]